MPRAPQPFDHGLWERVDDLFTSMSYSVLLKPVQEFGRIRIEIAVRHGGISIPFRSQESLDIPSIFFEESFSAIFRMSLKVQKETAPHPLCENVNSSLRRACENRIPGCDQLVRSYFVPSRMREAQDIRDSADQCMVATFRGLKDAKLLVR